MSNTTRTDPKGYRRPMAAGVIGNFVEWYDFGIYGYLAFALAANFFPGKGTGPLLSTFAVFGIAFLFRPLGGLIIGPIGDRVGRKATLAVIVLTISVATALIGILPTYDQIGWWAPIALVVLRSVQGLAAGGEYGGASSFVFEYAPKEHRGFLGGFLGVSTYFAFLVGSLFAFGLRTGLSEEAMLEWGWRIPFLAALPIGIVGLYLRSRVEESPEFRAVQRQGAVRTNPLRASLSEQRGLIFLLTGFLASNAVGPYLLITYIPTFLGRKEGLKPVQVLIATATTLFVICLLLPVAGHLSDRLGRKPIMLASTILYVLTPLPAFLLFGTSDTLLTLVGMLLIGVAQVASIAVTAVVIAEIFPTALRYSSASISYNVAYAIFGGTAPLVATWLVAASGSNLAPAYYVMVIAGLSTLFVLKLPETAPRHLATKKDKTISFPA